jgi:hypothetical protein
MSLIDDILGRKNPEPTLAPVDAGPDRTPWTRVWLTLRSVNLKELWPVVISVPAIVFFAISGMVAWLYLFLRGCVLFVRRLFK